MTNVISTEAADGFIVRCAVDRSLYFTLDLGTLHGSEGEASGAIKMAIPNEPREKEFSPRSLTIKRIVILSEASRSFIARGAVEGPAVFSSPESSGHFAEIS
jgi:hypothetical protein